MSVVYAEYGVDTNQGKCHYAKCHGAKNGDKNKR
jgi:hypothetical protein